MSNRKKWPSGALKNVLLHLLHLFHQKKNGVNVNLLPVILPIRFMCVAQGIHALLPMTLWCEMVYVSSRNRVLTKKSYLEG